MADRKDILVNKPHALYYNGELIGIITNPDPFGHMANICDTLSPDEGMADAVTIPHNPDTIEKWSHLVQVLEKLGVEGIIETED